MSTLAQTHVIQGRDVSFPIEVRRARMGQASYSVPAEPAARLLPPDAASAFELALDDAGRAQLSVGFVDYQENDLGDYHEVQISLMVRPAGQADAASGSFTVHMPVDQPFTLEAGNEMMGLTKTLEHIPIDYSADSVTGGLVSGGSLVFRLTVPRSPADPAAGDGAMELPCYSIIGGRPCRTVCASRGAMGMAFGEGCVLELGEHPWADELGSLGLPDTTPTLTTWAEEWAATFQLPEPVA